MINNTVKGMQTAVLMVARAVTWREEKTAKPSVLGCVSVEATSLVEPMSGSPSQPSAELYNF